MDPSTIFGIVKIVLFVITLGGCAMQQQTPADGHATEASGVEYTTDGTPADGIIIIRTIKGATDLF